MKGKITFIVMPVLLLTSCGSRNSEVKEYYDSIKAKLHGKQNNIDAT